MRLPQWAISSLIHKQSIYVPEKHPNVAGENPTRVIFIFMKHHVH